LEAVTAFNIIADCGLRIADFLFENPATHPSHAVFDCHFHQPVWADWVAVSLPSQSIFNNCRASCIDDELRNRLLDASEMFLAWAPWLRIPAVALASLKRHIVSGFESTNKAGLAYGDGLGCGEDEARRAGGA